MRHVTDDVLNKIPVRENSDSSPNDQLSTMYYVSSRLGMYDAGDFIANLLGNRRNNLLTSRELSGIPRLHQTQMATNDQIQELIPVADRLGFLDAANFFRRVVSGNF